MKAQEISIKEVYERLIQLETKFDMMERHNQSMDRKFSLSVLVVVTLEIINIFVHMLVKTRGM